MHGCSKRSALRSTPGAHKKAPVEHRGFCPSGFPTRVPNCATPRPGGSRADQLALASCAPVAALLHGWASTHRRDAPPDFGTSGRRMPPSSTSCCVKQLTCLDHHARTRFNWTLAGAALRIIRTQDTSSFDISHKRKCPRLSPSHHVNKTLAPGQRLCYSLVSSTHIAAFKAATAKEKKEGLDDKRRTPHNLASLLLTNTTLRSDSRTEQRFFNNQQSISVGV